MQDFFDIFNVTPLKKERVLDNFGIFKLLGSLYDFYKKTNTPKNDTADADSFSPLTSQNVSPDDNSKPNTKNLQQKPTVSPLQQNMLSVMYNHNAHVNRVMAKTTKPTENKTGFPHF